MKKTALMLACILLMLVLVGCGGNKDDGKLTIVVTAFPHYDFARQITQNVDNVEIKMLISPGNEVHTYEPSPSDILAVSTCDVFIYTGGESDTWAKKIIESADNEDMKVISFMDICSADGNEEEHEGHDHNHEYDEHVWTLPLFSQTICQEITRVLCETDSENANKYNENLASYTQKLSQLDKEFSDVLANAERDSIIVADRFPFTHFATHYKLKYHAAYPGCSSSTEPSAVVVAELSERVKNEKIPYVFTIEFSNQKIAKNVIEGTDAKILTLHSCHNVSKEDFENGITYYDLMNQNISNLRKALCE
ncbi:MAG: zinc ABC transporter substrate-binding protein [Ruminococcaceae bacterium]|nr:zinc ABC transporter substrate-binding protein [Oscillospiraceae bacterium]